MTSKRYLGNIITPTPTEPAGNLAVSSASGTWSLAEAFAYQKAGLWPIPGNFPLDITDVFSTYLYTGTGAAQTITNGIDLAGEGGLVWIKSRDLDRGHNLNDSERVGTGYKVISSDSTAAEVDPGNRVTAFNSDGFTMSTSTAVNASSEGYASWTFRKAPKFFDVVTYTGDGVNGRQISHNLGCEVGSILIKATSTGLSTNFWAVYHKDTPTTFGVLNGTNAFSSPNEGYTMANIFGDNTVVTLPTSTKFTVAGNQPVNNSGTEYVAYIFAHNDGDGEFGPNGDQDIIKCGSYTGNGSTQDIDLGFEPQFVLIKRASGGTGSWLLHDTMRGIATGGNDVYLQPHLSNAEVTTGVSVLDITSTGFHLPYSGTGYNASSSTYIYIAIRRGPLAPPESGTDVFDVDAQNGGSFVNTPFPVDFQINKNRTFASGAVAISRLTGGRALDTSSTGTEGGASYFEFDHQNGIEDNYQGIDGCIYWSFKRAPGFFDVVAYTGNGTAGRTVSHNLGVAPEMMWVKSRDGARLWAIYNEDLGGGKWLRLDSTNAVTTNNLMWNDTAPSDTSFTVGSSTAVNNSSEDYIAYLFASLDGVSKVGSYTGNGSSQTIDCGFTSGARFILIKRTDSTGDWYVWDTERGIVAGNDPHLSLNTTAAEVTSDDSIDPDNSGFIVNQVGATNINVSSAEYIFYAVA